MAVSNTENIVLNLQQQLGRDVMHALYPNDFEVYITALELVDSAGSVVEYLLFPLNVSSITIQKPTLVSIKKTIGGTSSMSTQTFVPFDIMIKGDFGRKIKFLIGQELVNFAAFNFSEIANRFNPIANFQKGVFSNQIKTGYGCMKMLERIVDKSQKLDSFDNPHSLHLYNLSFGQALLVKVLEFTPSQGYDKNMIWGYDLKIKALANLDQISQQSLNSSVIKNLSINAIQKGATRVLNKAIAALQ